MSIKLSVFIATSLDGFISRPDGALDWLDQANKVVPPGEDCGYAEFISAIDGLVMGRGTFEKVLSFPEWPFGELPVLVLSRSLRSLPAGTRPSVSLSSQTPAEVVASLSAQGLRHIYVDGGITIQGFLAASLIDELTITVIPVLLGSGRPLFGKLAGDMSLEHLSTRAYDFGFVQSKYRVDRVT